MASNLESGPESDMAGVRSPSPKKSHFGFLALVLILALVLAGGIFYQLSARKSEQKALAASVVENTETGAPVVTVGKVHAALGDATVDIVGQTAAFQETPIYTRTDGYLKLRNAEIGQHVRKGDVLFELDTPDLDQQVEQARATLAQSKAALAQLQATVNSLNSTMKLAQLTAGRTKTLADQGVLARQDADNATAAAESAEANLHAAQESAHAQESVINANDANIRRLLEQKKYARVEAPFDGVITSRNLQASDVGTLVSSGSATSAREIVRVSQIQTLRVYVNVPQNYAPLIRAGETATLLVDEFPGRNFVAKVQSTGNSLDPATRTMQTMLLIDNAQNTLLPGMFVKVRFQLPRRVNVLRLPAEALLVRSNGPTAAVVDASCKVHVQPVVLGRDFGTEVEVTTGLAEGDRVVLNPGDAIKDGSTVQVKDLPAKSGTAK